MRNSSSKRRLLAQQHPRVEEIRRIGRQIIAPMDSAIAEALSHIDSRHQTRPPDLSGQTVAPFTFVAHCSSANRTVYMQLPMFTLLTESPGREVQSYGRLARRATRTHPITPPVFYSSDVLAWKHPKIESKLAGGPPFPWFEQVGAKSAMVRKPVLSWRSSSQA